MDNREDLKLAKYMGGIGSIILFAQAVGLIGAIMVFISIKKISDVTDKKEIFSNYLKSFIFGALSIVVLTIFYFISFTIFASLNKGFNLSHSVNIILIFSFLLIPYIAFIISTFFKKKSFAAIGKELGIKAFEQAGNLSFAGAILSILFVGFIILFIAWIYEVIAFFSIDENRFSGSLEKTFDGNTSAIN